MAEATPRQERRYLVRTNDGDVFVVVNPPAGGLDDDLFDVAPATRETTAGIELTTPRSAFSAKAADIIQLHGTEVFCGCAALREMLVRENATALLRSIERFAKQGR